MLIAECTHPLKEFVGCRVDSALALYRLQNNSTGFLIYQSFYTVQLIKFCETDSREQRFKRFLVMFVAGYRESSEASAMERMIHGNDLMPCMTISGVRVFLCGF